MQYKPNGYTSLAPYLITDGAQRMADLLAAIFGARTLRRFDTPDGSVLHMELMIDDTVVMLADSSETYPANESLLHVYVPDVHQTFAKAVELGCTPIEEPVNKEGDPDTRGSFKDFQGNIWAVGTQKDES